MLAFFATISSLAMLASCRSLLPRSFSSSRVSFAVWLVLRSLSGLLCSFGLAPFSFWFGRSFHLSRVFCYLSWSFPWLFHGVFFRAPLLSVLPLGCSCLVGVLGALCLPPFCTFRSFVFFVSTGSFSSTGCRFYSSSYLCLFGFVPVLRLPSLTLRCLAVESSGCVSSSDFVLGGSSSFILLCFVFFILHFLRDFTSSFRFW